MFGKKIVKAIIAADLLMLNLLVGYSVYKSFQDESVDKEGKKEIRLFTPEEKTEKSGQCGEECRAYIDDKFFQLNSAIDTLSNDLANVKKEPTPFTQVAAPVSKSKSVSYVPIPGSGNTVKTDWTVVDGTDFYLSKSDYPGLVGIYFEANMKLLNGNGTAFLRLYDATHGIGVSGSEIKTENQASTFISSGAINLWDGYNHYQVQAKSLTADTTVFESGKLKIITEN